MAREAKGREDVPALSDALLEATADVRSLHAEHAATQQLLEERSGLLAMRVAELNKAREDHLARCDKRSGEIRERNAHCEREIEKATGFWMAKNVALAGDLRLMHARAEEAERRAAGQASEIERLRAHFAVVEKEQEHDGRIVSKLKQQLKQAKTENERLLAVELEWQRVTGYSAPERFPGLTPEQIEAAGDQM